MFKVNNKKHQNNFIDAVLVSLLLNSNIFVSFCSVSVVDFEQVNVSWMVMWQIFMQFNFVSILLFVSRLIIKEYWFKIFSCQFEITRKTIRKPLNIAIWYEEDLVRSYNWNILGESWNEYLCIKLDLCFACGKFFHERMIKASVAFWLYFDESFCFFFFKIPKNEFEDHSVMLECLHFTDVLFHLGYTYWKCCEELTLRYIVSCGTIRNCVVAIVCKMVYVAT